MKIDSPYWDWKNGVCRKHLLPQVPCPKCLHAGDPDLEIKADPVEVMGLADPEVWLLTAGSLPEWLQTE